MSANTVISTEYRGRVAVITIDNVAKLNALNKEGYYEIGLALREIDTHPEVYITVLLAKGRYFSAGADVSISRENPTEPKEVHKYWMQNFAANNLNVTCAFAEHSKILVVGLNGPAVGLSAALIGHADFIYAHPSAFLLTPFSSIGLVAEGGASRALALRLGPARAGEALIMSRRIGAVELEKCGFLNAIFDEGGAVGEEATARFHKRLFHEIDERLGEHLNGDSLVGIKKLIKDPERAIMESQNVKEVLAGVERFAKGVPQEEFRKLASGEKRHKL